MSRWITPPRASDWVLVLAFAAISALVLLVFSPLPVFDAALLAGAPLIAVAIRWFAARRRSAPS